MKRFTALYEQLDATTRTNEKLDALVAYFRDAAAADAAWAVYFLSGRRPKRLVPARLLRQAAREATGIPDWLLEECYGAVGDSAETAALLIDTQASTIDLPLHRWMQTRILPLRRLDDEAKIAALQRAWSELGPAERFVFNKLLTGALRVGVSQRLLTRALARHSGLDAALLAHRLTGTWEPSAAFHRRLLDPDVRLADASRPYPFYLAHPLDTEPEDLGDVTDWQAEWKWDGIRAQLLRREGTASIWSRGEENVTEQFPEILESASWLPDGTVLDGELVVWSSGGVLPFARLQKRLGRKTPSARVLAESPVALLAYDVLENAGADVRARPLSERRTVLEDLLASAADSRLLLSPVVPAQSWQELRTARLTSRERGVEGLMLKHRGGAYEVGRKRGGWWKWKVDPYTVDAVLVYARRGSGRRAGLYTDYSFAVWDNGRLVKFAEAYSGLSDQEILEVDRFIRRNTTERYGPVRAVRPQIVAEIAFEDIRRSPRHKAGIAVRFPRIVRLRRDKAAEEADSIATLRALLAGTERRGPTA